MKMKLCLALGILLTCCAVSQADEFPDGVLGLLEKAEQWEVLSLEPFTPASSPKETFRGWEVVGKTTVKDAKSRAKLLDALKEGVKGYKDAAPPRRCYKPRHGVRVSHGGKTLELLICFSCEKIRAYIGGEEELSCFVLEKPATVFNEFLKEAKVPLPKN